MNRECDTIRDLIADSVSGTLVSDQAGYIEEHLCECADCRSYAEALKGEDLLLAQLVGRIRTDTTARQEQLLQAFRPGQSKPAGGLTYREAPPAAKGKNKDQTRRGSESPAALFGRIIMKNRMTKLAVAAVVILAVALGLSLFTGNGTAKVYARMVDQVRNAQTLTYSVITKTGVDSMPTVHMDVAFKNTGFVRTVTADGYITVAQSIGNKVKGLSIVPVAKNFVTFEVANMPDDPAKDPWAMIEMLRALPARADQVLGRAEVDGRMLDGFRVREDDTIATVWIDPASGQLARVELECPSAPGMNVIMSNFQFDVPLEDTFFSLEPPEGYTPLEVQADVAGVGERDFVEFLRAWSLWTVDATFPPLVAGPETAKVIVHMAQEDKFKRGWDFDFGRQQVVYRGLLFISGLPAGTWRYAGQNISFGDPLTPIFWYQPQGSPTWRVVYADLSTADVTAENLPK